MLGCFSLKRVLAAIVIITIGANVGEDVGEGIGDGVGDGIGDGIGLPLSASVILH